MKNYDMQKNDMAYYDTFSRGKCIPQETTIDNVRLAAAYVPFQFMCDLYNPVEALKKGTAFPELFSPYDPKDRRNHMGKPSGFM